ncbi:MAG: Acyl-homoserine lactone (AHL) acylase PvdQ [Chloroflexi bacterium AL-W]|nr:Acyl-homoserine lactone (AHL) acylase PvdQ [Chloroflexi bacterium AL-N1]NOK69661.1 Acyl-homoserine lactone (AHL) acylase PvdQ [Chloroflexi bacterium AL-N10]NOK72208.1 Acyl-homoserine lactone (AHL) acylase PvdQ [Chloroflexi bacterium AL-N5]NOK85037.1 Acyl-homoserine lactone (AHL) acylase PvdQ [Chloroflexi bacterium AL-W]NOK91790.1 Acyl-homoserine lactone (AHL) acylase PvdQ [Chloroflexi bacterium AL-N15]
MVTLTQIGKTVGIALGAAAGIAGIGTFAAMCWPLPKQTGTQRLVGLDAPVQVLRDHWGVPHIYATSNRDLFMAQGYVHAQDRLWQMEFQRRVGHGQLAEIFGRAVLPVDRYIRMLGFNRVVQQEEPLFSDETREAVEAYVQGVNTYIAQHARRLPIEFSILRFRPQVWRPVDILALGKYIALGLSENWPLEVLRAHMVTLVGEERAKALDVHYPGDHPLTIPEGVNYRSDLGTSLLRDITQSPLSANGTDGVQGSNAWVVNGKRSVSGMPLLANDPHLVLQIPSIWYENHLVGKDFHVTGASFPGCPGVIIGHNEWVAWGITNGMTDVQDVYIERFDSANPTQYMFQSQWEQAMVVREEIAVRGEPEPHIEEVRLTRHGPIITELVTSQDQQTSTVKDPQYTEEYALRWTALEPGRVVDAILAYNQARDWQHFRRAVGLWPGPTQNFVYADVQGHIGYTLAGRVPIRTKGDGRLPVPAWTGEYEWSGYVATEELPHMLDPDDGCIVTANNRIMSVGYPHTLSSEWLNGYRAKRIYELLEQTTQHDTRSFEKMHSDVRSLPGLALAALTGRLPVVSSVAQQARNALATWDGELSVDSIGGTIYTVFRGHLQSIAYAEVSESCELITGLGMLATLPSERFLIRALPSVIDRMLRREDTWLPDLHTWDDVIAEAWNATIAELREFYGDNVQTWRYGRFHTLTLRHPLSAVPALAPIFNRGPFPTGGDIDTVCMGYLPQRFVGGPRYTGASYRQICDTADWDRSLSIHPTGQSGHPASQHYADFVQPWLEGHYHPMLWSRMRVEEATDKRLTLAPAHGVEQKELSQGEIFQTP